MDVFKTPEASTLLAKALIAAADVQIRHELQPQTSRSVRDIEGLVGGAIHRIILPFARTSWIQRNLLRNNVGADPRFVRREPPIPVELSPDSTEALCIELHRSLTAILTDDPEPLFTSVRDCHGRVQERAEQQEREAADRMLRRAVEIMADPRKHPSMKCLLLIEQRHDIGSLLRDGEPGMFVYPPHPLEPWVTPYDQYWEGIPERLVI